MYRCVGESIYVIMGGGGEGFSLLPLAPPYSMLAAYHI